MITTEVGGWVWVSLEDKYLLNWKIVPKQSILVCFGCIYTLLNVVINYDLSVPSCQRWVSQKNWIVGGWVGGMSSIQFCGGGWGRALQRARIQWLVIWLLQTAYMLVTYTHMITCSTIEFRPYHVTLIVNQSHVLHHLYSSVREWHHKFTGLLALSD